jgi:hypothetical protein
LIAAVGEELFQERKHPEQGRHDENAAYRHLGNPRNFPLPKNPPTLVEARLFATDSLKDWIARHT